MSEVLEVGVDREDEFMYDDDGKFLEFNILQNQFLLECYCFFNYMDF